MMAILCYGAWETLLPLLCTSKTTPLSWFLLDLTWHPDSLHDILPDTFTANWRSSSEWANLADWVYFSLHHSSLPIPCECLWQVALLWQHTPIFLPDAGSIRNGAQIRSCRRMGVLWYGSHADGGGEFVVTVQCREESIDFYATYVHMLDNTEESLQQHARERESNHETFMWMTDKGLNWSPFPLY